MSNTVEGIKNYLRAANYLSAIQIYLWDNFLLQKPLTSSDIKPRLLGHWGSAPGINFIYANLNYLINKYAVEILFVLGPGHGFAALQANLFIEGTLRHFYPEAKHDSSGIGYIAKNFSWPYGFPSHSNPGAPGVILEGGELGYSLSTSYGAALDNPELIVACVIGDGEAETGSTATAWHLNKFINPATSGAVLPILHLNGYKISSPSIFGRMSDRELLALFEGYGYEPLIVSEPDIHETMIDVLDHSYHLIRQIQKDARENPATPTKTAPRFPMIILKTKKGWTGIKELKGKKLEGNCLSHQVIAPNAKSDPIELKALDEWFRSYRFNELFSDANGFIDEIKNLVPRPELRMGQNKHAFGGEIVDPLILPPIDQFIEDASVPGRFGSSPMIQTGGYLKEVFRLNEENHNFRFMSPDETYSNKLDSIFKSTSRTLMQPLEPWDKDLSHNGRVIEMLSEHSLQGLVQGYILTGRHAIFASYEAFIQVVSSMADQYAKFIKVAREYPWRGNTPSLNYILTSSGWRQEHNGFSHQNPGFISDMLQKSGCFIKVYFPPDGNSTLVVLKECLASQNSINIIVAGKTIESRWLTTEQAEEELKAGLAIWKFASDDNPDIVLASIGDYLTIESLAALKIIKNEIPTVKVRFVNIIELSMLIVGECHTPLDFEKYFTPDKPVIFNFHGYPGTLKQILFNYPNTGRLSVHGYVENGSTTTPFDMHVRNQTSRWHLAIEAFKLLARHRQIDTKTANEIVHKYEQKLLDHHQYVIKHGIDPPEIADWKWSKTND